MCLVGELSIFRVDITTVEEAHCACAEDCQVLEGDFVVFSAFGSRCNGGISWQVGHSLNAMVDLVFTSDGGQLVGADVYASKNVDERHSYFQ